jgi:hypothetical protein
VTSSQGQDRPEGPSLRVSNRGNPSKPHEHRWPSVSSRHSG